MLGYEPLKCPSCNNSVYLEGDSAQVKTAVCPSCAAVIYCPDHSAPTTDDKVDETLASVFQIPLDATGTLKGVEWKVVGRVRSDWNDDGESGYSLEYVLYNSQKGYCSLSEEKGHYTLGDVVEMKPEASLFSGYSAKKKIKIEKKNYLFTEQGTLVVTYLDGAIPWETELDEKIEYAEAVCPPYLFGEERCLDTETGQYETEYYKEEYIPANKVAKAFGFEKSSRGVAPAQPYEPLFTRERLVSRLASALTVLLFFGMCYASVGGTQVYTQSYEFNKLTHLKGETLLPVFKITEPGETLELNFRNGRSNSWMEVGLALVREKDNAVITAEDRYLEYYEGYEGGESWSEGSRDTDIYWKVKEPGDYRILLTIWDTDAESAPLTITLQRGVHRAYLLAILFCLWCIVPMFFFFRRHSFETRRWSDFIGS